MNDTDDKRLHRRVPAQLSGRMMLPDTREFACETLNVSPGGSLISSKATPSIGARIVAYIEEVGRIEGDVARITSEGFAVNHRASGLRRQRIADVLTWIANKKPLGLADLRRHVRLKCRGGERTHITLKDGRSGSCPVIDMSLGGVAVRTGLRPRVGDEVLIKRTWAKVARHLKTGIALEYVQPVRVIDHFA